MKHLFAFDTASLSLMRLHIKEMEKKISKSEKNSYRGKWVLLDKKNKVIYSHTSLSKVMTKGKEYPKDMETIEKNSPQRTCFFYNVDF